MNNVQLDILTSISESMHARADRMILMVAGAVMQKLGQTELTLTLDDLQSAGHVSVDYDETTMTYRFTQKAD